MTSRSLSRCGVLTVSAVGFGGPAIGMADSRAEPAAKPGGAGGVFELSVGSAPAPVPCDHFPTPVHALVWPSASAIRRRFRPT